MSGSRAASWLVSRKAVNEERNVAVFPLSTEGNDHNSRFRS